MLFDSLLLIVALIILFFGAEFALDASEKIGKRLGLSPMVIGMLLVGFGTSLPEFFVSHLACLQNDSGIALGNIIGSNLANLLLILGVSGLWVTLPTGGGQMKQTFLAHTIVTVLLVVVLQFSTVNPWTTTILFVYFFYYLFILYLDHKKQNKICSENNEQEEISDDSKLTKKDAFQFFKMVLGFYGLYYGGDLLVVSGTSLCTKMGWPSYVISAIFIAFGTSFPELVTSLVACYKQKETELIVGNVIGSNIFNVAFVLGSLGVYNFPIERSFTLELVVLVALCVHLFVAGRNQIDIGRKTASFYLLGYFGLVSYWIFSI